MHSQSSARFAAQMSVVQKALCDTDVLSLHLHLLPCPLVLHQSCGFQSEVAQLPCPATSHQQRSWAWSSQMELRAAVLSGAPAASWSLMPVSAFSYKASI